MFKIKKFDPVELPTKIKLLIYGSPGVGKTVFCSQFPSPLFIDSEKGMAAIEKQIDYVSITNFEEFQELLKDIIENVEEYKKKYKTIVVDSVTELQKRSLDYILKKAVQNNISRDPNLITQQDWGKNTESMRKALRSLRDLSEHFNIVLTALSREVSSEGNLIKRPDLTPSLFSSLNSYLDIMGYMMTKTEENEDKKMEVTRYLIFANTNKFIAKSRIRNLSNVIKNPTWEKFNKSLKGGK